MGYWIHVDDLPTGGGGSSGPDWGGCLGCFGFLVVVFFLWGLNESYGLDNVLVFLVSRALLLGSVSSRRPGLTDRSSSQGAWVLRQ